MAWPCLSAQVLCAGVSEGHEGFTASVLASTSPSHSEATRVPWLPQSCSWTQALCVGSYLDSCILNTNHTSRRTKMWKNKTKQNLNTRKLEAWAKRRTHGRWENIVNSRYGHVPVISVLGRPGQEDRQIFMASLGYIAMTRPWSYWQDPVWGRRRRRKGGEWWWRGRREREGGGGGRGRGYIRQMPSTGEDARERKGNKHNCLFRLSQMHNQKWYFIFFTAFQEHLRGKMLSKKYDS